MSGNTVPAGPTPRTSGRLAANATFRTNHLSQVVLAMLLDRNPPTQTIFTAIGTRSTGVGLTMARPLFTAAEWSQIVEALSLSPRKAAIAALVLRDMKDEAIARALHLSKPTVRTHLNQMFRSLQVTSRLGLAVRVFATYRNVIEQSDRHK